MNSINDMPMPVNNMIAGPAMPQQYQLSNNNEGFGLPSPVESLDDFLISEFDLWDNNWESIVPPQQQQPAQPQPIPEQIPQQQQQPQQQQSFQEFLDIVLIVQQQQEQIQQLQQQLQQITTIPSPSSSSSPSNVASSISVSTNKYIDFSF
jgi:hypothetical protein